MVLTDNAKYSSIPGNIEEFLILQSIANRKISELLDDNGNNLLIYPHSFYECEDEAGKQQLFSLQTSWNGKQFTNVSLKTGNIVGFVGVNGQSVSIHSRFSKDADKDFFLHYMLQKVLCINVVNLSHGMTDEQVFDFLLYLFPKLLNEALAQGIYKEYQRNEYNKVNVCGAIDINRHLRKNLPFNGRIAYRTREFSYDNHVTELIRHTIEYIGKTKFGRMLLENDAETRASVAQIISATPRYSRQEREKMVKSNLKVISHPYFSHYAPLQKLCLRILRNERIKYGKKEDKIYGILFDVSYLWEEYLAMILMKQGFKHPKNKKGEGRIYLAKQSMFPRYPDFYRELDGTIIDAKYKVEIDQREDVNQMITYMYRLNGKYGIFIQPTAQGYLRSTYHLLGYGAEKNAELQTYLFQIPQNINDYKNFVERIKDSENILRSQIPIL